nr:PRD domain-containing protein [uncultured Enterobacter sp.]
MIISKILNNNSVIATNREGEEIVVSGSGIGYNQKPGRTLDKRLINKVYYIKEEHKEQIYDLIKKVNIEYIHVAEKIITLAEKQLGETLSSSIIFSLIDHIANAIARQQQQITLPNLFLDEIAMLYPQEHAIAEQALGLIARDIGIVLPPDEIGYIAIHLINNYQRTDVSVSILELVKDIIEIVERNYHCVLPKKSFEYSRFMTHLKFFAHRIINKEEVNDCDFRIIFEYFTETDFQLKNCIGQISHYIKTNHQREVKMAESLYLSIHIKNVMSYRIN